MLQLCGTKNLKYHVIVGCLVIERMNKVSNPSETEDGVLVYQGPIVKIQGSYSFPSAHPAKPNTYSILVALETNKQVFLLRGGI